MNPGPVVLVRKDKLVDQPNRALRQFRDEAAAAVRRARLDPDTAVTVWALLLAADGWTDVAGWVRSRLTPR